MSPSFQMSPVSGLVNTPPSPGSAMTLARSWCIMLGVRLGPGQLESLLVGVVVDGDSLKAEIDRGLDQPLPAKDRVSQLLLQLPGSSNKARHSRGKRA